uniref:Uncharacterized protein n=1 Tax=Tetranychus urticae TaxID=32264 RepID=T1K7G8_TETUR
MVISSDLCHQIVKSIKFGLISSEMEP